MCGCKRKICNFRLEVPTLARESLAGGQRPVDPVGSDSQGGTWACVFLKYTTLGLSPHCEQLMEDILPFLLVLGSPVVGRASAWASASVLVCDSSVLLTASGFLCGMWV